MQKFPAGKVHAALQSDGAITRLLVRCTERETLWRAQCPLRRPARVGIKGALFARKILMGAIDMNMDAIETMLAPNGKFGDATRFASENEAICPGLLPFCYLMGAVGAGRAIQCRRELMPRGFIFVAVEADRGLA